VTLITLLTAAAFGATPDLRLADAAKGQNRELVRSLLTQRASVNAAQPDGATALHWVVHWDDLETADLLIQSGADVNAANDLGVTPLYLACANGNVAMVNHLLAAGAKPGAATSSGETALMTATRTGIIEIVKALLESGADVNAREKTRNQTALMWAVAKQRQDVVRLLLAHGADVHARSRPVDDYVIRDKGGAKARLAGETIQRGGSTPLLFAARLGSVESARILLDAGAGVNDTAPDGTSALLMAAYSGHVELAEFLLDRGAKPDAETAGYTALHITALTGDMELVKALLAHGANPNVRLKKGTPVTRFGAEQVLTSSLAGATPLIIAARQGEPEIMRVLLAAGADPKVAMNDGTTLLMAAIPDKKAKVSKGPGDPKSANHALDALRLALESGIDINGTNNAGQTALEMAESKQLDELVQMLREKGATPQLAGSSRKR
jgi:ankyrin repeat protein